MTTATPTTINPAERTWAIAEVARAYDVTARTVRFYEDRGLLTPERRGTTRLFHPRDRVRLGLILRGKRLGFSLDEIATIIDMYDAEPGETGQLNYLLDEIERRRRELAQRRRDIDTLLDDLDDVERRCRADLTRLSPPPSANAAPPRGRAPSPDGRARQARTPR